MITPTFRSTILSIISRDLRDAVSPDFMVLPCLLYCMIAVSVCEISLIHNRIATQM